MHLQQLWTLLTACDLTSRNITGFSEQSGQLSSNTTPNDFRMPCLEATQFDVGPSFGPFVFMCFSDLRSLWQSHQGSLQPSQLNGPTLPCETGPQGASTIFFCRKIPRTCRIWRKLSKFSHLRAPKMRKSVDLISSVDQCTLGLSILNLRSTACPKRGNV